jgi:hypothetical protein
MRTHPARQRKWTEEDVEKYFTQCGSRLGVRDSSKDRNRVVASYAADGTVRGPRAESEAAESDESVGM